MTEKGHPILNMSAVFGFFGGIFTSVIFQPLDVIKMSIMLSKEEKNISHKLIATARTIIRDRGILALWKGLGVSTVRNACGAAVYFSGLRYLQRVNQGMNFFNSAAARIISSIIVNPISIMETKILMPGSKAVFSTGLAYNNLIDRKQRLKAMSKGVLAACIKEGMFAGVYYEIFEEIKTGFQTIGDNYNTGINFMTGVLAGLIATASSHPFEIARAQIQADMKPNIRSAFYQIYQTEGWHGFFKGLSPRLLRKPVINTTTFVIVEKLELLKLKLSGSGNSPLQ